MRITLLILFVLVIASCSRDTKVSTDFDEPVLAQISVFDALLQGIYDGCFPVNELPDMGDVGLGTYDALNGELIMLNDTVYQVLASGEVKIAGSDMLTPFATVSDWESDTAFTIKNGTFDLLRTNFDSFFPTRNIFYAVKIEGLFSYVKTRSVPKQTKPYPALAVVAANQPTFEFNNIRGTIIGFYCPPFASGMNMTGLHFHFLTNDRKGGGHLLQYQIEEGKLEICPLYNYRLILPEGGDFFGGNFTIDRTEELEKAEK